MSAWVALLRGVNVGGVTVKSAELAEVFRGLGFGDVKTVLATGNVLFSSSGEEEEHANLVGRIETALAERFGYDARVVLVARDAMAQIAAGYPFPEDGDHHGYVVFSSSQTALDALMLKASVAGTAVPEGAVSEGAASEPAVSEAASDAAGVSAVVQVPGELVARGDGVLYWRCPRGSSTTTTFSQTTSKAAVKPFLTTRNLNTVRKLV